MGESEWSTVLLRTVSFSLMLLIVRLVMTHSVVEFGRKTQRILIAVTREATQATKYS